MPVIVKKPRDRLRNRFFRWIGIVPADDFDSYVEAVYGVLSSFEDFSKETADWSKLVNTKLKIDYHKQKDSKDRGMFG